ncbi:TetR/AcrR family transcriptional regulator [Novosphingobium rosa]|uniref:TetR/AcrR family transcriptional regulator n=1 Tax=Novosphingobium rosa TaxID=76978 RepID=UPI00082B3BB8|nr:TetR/AcrR family transcriptional regulator [Novosphingobium rosa]
MNELALPPSANDLRRAEVIACAAELLVEGGMGAITVRNIARRMACSTTVVSHHFRNKDEVVLETYRHVNARAAALRDAALSNRAYTAVRALEELLPISDAQRDNWSAWLHFWSAALHNPALAAEHARGLQQTVGRVLDYLRSIGMDDAQARGAAQAIGNALYGIAIQALFDRDHWDEARLRREFRRTTTYALGPDIAGRQI